MVKCILNLPLGSSHCLLLRSSRELLDLPKLSICLHCLLLHHLAASVGFTISLTSKTLLPETKAPSPEVLLLLTFRPTPSTCLMYLTPDHNTPHGIKRLTTTSTLSLNRRTEKIHPLLRREQVPWTGLQAQVVGSLHIRRNCSITQTDSSQRLCPSTKLTRPLLLGNQ